MNIVFATTVVDYSGAPKMMMWIANQMAMRGHNVKVVSFYSKECLQPCGDNVGFCCLNARRSNNRLVRNTIDLFSTTKLFNNFVKANNPDVVVTFLDSVGYTFLLKNKFSGKYRTVASERSDPSSHRGFSAIVRHRLMRFADAIVFQTAGARDFFKGRFSKKSAVIPNPVIPPKRTHDLLPVKYKDRDDIIVSVGRLSLVQKRQDILIEAFDSIHKKYDNVKLYIYGSGDDEEIIKKLIEKKQLENYVVLAGRTDDVEKSIRKARAFVLTSDYEGVPNSLIEAMMFGVPSISTDCSPGGAALLIEDGKNGFLVPKADTKSISDKLEVLISNEQISDLFSANSVKIVDKFSEKTIADMWENTFKNVLK